MANHNQSNNTICRDAFLTMTEQRIPILVVSFKDYEIVSDEACGSHCVIDVLEIPNYLSLARTKRFERMIQEKMSGLTSSININALNEIAILIHQLHIINFEISLWTIYVKSGTAKILEPHESTLKVWPTCVKSMIQSSKRIITTNDINGVDVNNDDICLKFVIEHLYELNNKQVEIQQQLSQKKKQFHGYTSTIDDILQTFIQQHLQYLRCQYEYKIKFVILNYQEHVLEHAFVQQNPSEQQKQLIKGLFGRKFDHEKAIQDVRLIKQQIVHNKLFKPFECVQIPLPCSIYSLTDMNLREQLQTRHDNITNQYKHEMSAICTEITEVKLRESETLFDDEMRKFWQDQRSLSLDERQQRRGLNPTIIDLIDRFFTLITSQIECIYNYRLQQLRIKVPIIQH